MKKKNKKIVKQILKGMLAVALMTVIMFAVISFIGLKRVQKEIILSDSQIIEELADAEIKKVTDSISEEMMGVCENLSLNCSEKMSKYMEELKICTDIITDIYENPDNYGSRQIGIPSEETRDKLCMYYSLNEAMDYESKRWEIEKIGCSWQTFQSVYESSRLNSIYYTTKDGILFSFDVNSGEVLDKLKEGQSPLYLHGYEPRDTEWYKNSCNDTEGSVKFSSTYLDSTGNLVVTCSSPVYKNDEYMGVMAIDIYLGNLEDELIGTDDIKYDGFVEIADSNGNVIVSPSLKGNKEDYRHINIITDNDEGLVEIAESMVAGETGTQILTYKGQTSEGVYMPVEYTGWSIAVIFNTDMVMDDIYESYGYIMEANNTTEQNVENIIENIIVFFVGGALVIMAAGSLLARLLSLRITRPVGALIKDVNVISGGELDYRVSINTGNELEELGEAFNKMTSSLKEHMSNLKRVTADKERISTELDVASQIQLSLLPDKLTAFDRESSFDVCAFMKPAKEVGGDFYDYFMTDDNHLWLVAADVSGKGIPASLFMMMGKTLIKNMAKTIGTPAEILRAANSQLNEHNDAMMFITCIVCVIELSTGRMTFANAGHNFPLYHTEGKSFIRLENTPDLPLAVMEDTDYENHYTDLNEGDRLFLYTDGVTEAMDIKGDLYGEARLCRVLNKSKAGEIKTDVKAADILQLVQADLNSFSKDTVQADDITMVSFLYKRKKREEGADCERGENKLHGKYKEELADCEVWSNILNFKDDFKNSLKVRADLRELSHVIGFVEKRLSSEGFSTEFITTIKFMADELFSNIAMYAYGGAEDDDDERNVGSERNDDSKNNDDSERNDVGESNSSEQDIQREDTGRYAVVTVNILENNGAELVLEDWGKPYNPLNQKEPDISVQGEERMEGGLGVYLVKSLADEMEYKYDNGKNVVVIRKSVKEGD